MASNNKEKQRINSKRWRERHKDKMIIAGIADRERYATLDRSYIYHLVKRAEKRAKEKGIPFGICVEDIQIPTHCPVLGIKLEAGTGKGPSDSSPSLDRISPELGYVKDNVRIISMKANRIKSDASAEEIEKVLNYLREQVR